MEITITKVIVLVAMAVTSAFLVIYVIPKLANKINSEGENFK